MNTLQLSKWNLQLLTHNSIIFKKKIIYINKFNADLQFENTCRQMNRPRAHNLCLTRRNYRKVSYPGGHFAGNQQIGTSMSLSPLHAPDKKDLHVIIPTGLHLSFNRLHPRHAKLSSSRVWSVKLKMEWKQTRKLHSLTINCIYMV